jgi:uncharacterized repeat protein (TIGR03803 family)
MRTLEHRISISLTRLRAAIVALALPIILALAVVTTPPAQAQTFDVLYSFTGGTDGGEPVATLLRDTKGNLYGTTLEGGTSGVGTVFKLDKTDNETVLYAFSGGADGGYPESNLVQDSAGNLYGTTLYGGTGDCKLGCGVVFKLDTAGKETVLHSFKGSPDGNYPSAGLVRDAAGNLYGTTPSGGTSSAGVVFRVAKTGKEKVLYTFTGGKDGGNPFGGLIQDAAGNLYGTTTYGGDLSCNNGFGCGTVFKLSKTGKETVLYSFMGGGDAEYPYSDLVLDGKGNFYGTTLFGGASGAGAVFKLSKTGKETVLYSFTGGSDGKYPYAGLVRDRKGNLYGATEYGGSSSYGTVFELDTAGAETVLHNFTDGSDGGYPIAGLILNSSGSLYGAAQSGGSGGGTVFKITH